MPEDLLEKIAEIDQEVAENLRDGGLSSDDVKDLCFEALKEIIPTPGMKGILLRSRIWKVISLENGIESSSANSSPSSFEKIKVSVPKKRKLDPIVIDYEESSTSEDSSASQSPVVNKKVVKTSQFQSPEYTIYQDREIDMAVKSGSSIPVELRHRIIRGTIHNMVSLAFNPPWSRMPTNNEVLEMAKSLIITYPSLSDPATKHVVLFKQLKKRLYNMKPVEKKRGPRVKKEPKPNCTESVPNDTSQPLNSDSMIEVDFNETVNREPNVPYSKDIMERHYVALSKEMHKNKQSPTVINMYLNKEFEARRKRIESMSPEERHKKVFEAYPCFRDHVEIIEGVRRILKLEESDDPEEFLKQCLRRFADEIEHLIYFGVANQRIGHPSKPSKVAEVIHLMKHINLMFGGSSGKAAKQGKKTCDLVYAIKEHEDPDAICKKISGKVPMLMVDSTLAYLVCKGSILLSVKLEKIQEAAIALIAVFYLLDIDYPRSHELGLTVLQHLVFEDKNTPGDIINVFTSAMAEYTKFKNS